MRGSAAGLLALALAGLGAAWGIGCQVGGAWEAVEVSERVLYGDQTAAWGAVVTNRTQCDGHLFWDTSYTVGDGLQVEAGARFTQQRTSTHGRPDASADVYCSTNFGMSGTNVLDGENEQGVAIAPAYDVATRTQPGTTRTETVRLSDYYEYYPLTLDLYIPGSSWGLTEQALADFAEHFHIPVPPSHRVEVSVTKNAEGQVENVECNTVEGEQAFYARTEVTETGIYLAFDGQGLPADLAGVHRIPFIQEGTVGRVQAEAICQVWAPDGESRVLGLSASRDGSRLLVAAQAGGRTELAVLDMESGALVQAVQLPCGGPGAELVRIYQYEGFAAPVFADGGFCVLAGSGEAGYELRLAGDLTACPEVGEAAPLHDLALAYDGRQLAVAFYQQPYRWASTYLLVYGAQGLAYAGQYDQSTDRTPPGTLPQVSPVDEEPLAVAWG